MTSFNESQILVAELEAAIPGILATKYLSGMYNKARFCGLSQLYVTFYIVAGLVILLYDHLLLLQEEVRPDFRHPASFFDPHPVC